MLIIVMMRIMGKMVIADEGAWGYNFVSQMGFRQSKMCEKETSRVNLVLLCKAKTKHRSKTHLSPLSRSVLLEFKGL